MRPVYDAAFFVPDILTVHSDRNALSDWHPVGFVGIVRHSRNCRAIGRAQEKSLVGQALCIIRQNSYYFRRSDSSPHRSLAWPSLGSYHLSLLGRRRPNAGCAS